MLIDFENKFNEKGLHNLVNSEQIGLLGNNRMNNNSYLFNGEIGLLMGDNNSWGDH